MDKNITTYEALKRLVYLDTKEHGIKTMATLFLTALNDWKETDTRNIFEFINDLKQYFGNPLTKERIKNHIFKGSNTWWNMEAANSIVEMFNVSVKFYNEPDFDKIVENFLSYYNSEFEKVDFIAVLKYLTTEQIAGKTPINSGYTTQIKFELDEMPAFIQLTFIDQEIMYPGDTVDVKIKMRSTRNFTGSLMTEMCFELLQGVIVVGKGRIKFIINDKLEK